MATINANVKGLSAVIDNNGASLMPFSADMAELILAYYDSLSGLVDLLYYGEIYSKSSDRLDIRADTAQLAYSGSNFFQSEAVISNIAFDSDYVSHQGLSWSIPCNISRTSNSYSGFTLTDGATGNHMTFEETGTFDMNTGDQEGHRTSSTFYTGDYKMAVTGSVDYAFSSAGLDVSGYANGLSVSYRGQTILSATGFKVDIDDLAEFYASTSSEEFFASMLSGNDKITGGSGNDIMNGHAGSDKLTGGLGADSFVFDLDDYNFSGKRKVSADTVTGFSAAQGDQIDLSSFGDLSIVATKEAGIAAGDALFYETTKGSIYYDATGSGNYQAIVKITGAPKLDLDNFA